MVSSSHEVYTLLVVPTNSINAQIEILQESCTKSFDKEIKNNTKFLYFNNSYINLERVQDYIFPCDYLDKQKRFIYYKSKGNILNLDLKEMQVI